MTSCDWCHGEMKKKGARFCSQKCRQSAFRLRRRSHIEQAGRGELVFAYADPPYPGTAKKYYETEPTYAGEVDHPKLIASLTAKWMAGELAGWALSTSARALRDVLPLCPEGARVCPWVKPNGVSGQTYGLHNVWEPLIVVGGRKRRPGIRDFLIAKPARGGGTLPGRKPIAFCAWLFDCLGMLPGDRLVDVFPGTGIVSRAWSELERVGFAEGEDVAEVLDDAVDVVRRRATQEGERVARELGIDVDAWVKDIRHRIDVADRRASLSVIEGGKASSLEERQPSLTPAESASLTTSGDASPGAGNDDPGGFVWTPTGEVWFPW
jgi:hypothetical protein